MNTHVALTDLRFTDSTLRVPGPHFRAALLGAVLCSLLSGPAFAGGADVSTDEINSDDVLLVDIDGDDNLDLAVAANGGGRSRYYLGNGDGTFSQAPVELTTGVSSEIVAGLLNADTFIDLAQGRRDLTNLRYLGDGAGGVVTPGVAITADADRTLSLALGDLDGDGFIDMVAGNGRNGGTGVAQVNRYYVNDGNGNFTSFVISADADDTRSIALADIDGDTDLDVIVGNDETTPDSNRIYLNQVIPSTTLSFAAGVNFGDPDDQTNKLLVGDLDGDGDSDIVTLNNVSAGSPGVNRFFINNSAGGVLALSAAMDVSADAESTSGGTLADFDGDGNLDLAVANLATTPGVPARNKLYLNQVATPGGAVSFAAAQDISTDEHQSRELAAADLNGDGHIDIIVGNQDNVAGVRDRRYLNNGNMATPFTNVAPVVASQVGPLTTDEDTALTIELDDVTVTDPDNVFPDDFTLTVQAGTSYTVAGNTITPDAGVAGDLTVPVIVNDGTDDSAAFDLTVTVSNTINTAPQFTSTPDMGAVVDEVYTYNVVATDADAGDTLTISAAAALPAWLTLTDNGGGMATLTGTPAITDIGDHAISLQVTDGTETVMQDFTITVEAVATNNPPAFSSTAVTEATVGTAYTYSVTATDADGDTLVISAAVLPAWLTLTDNGGGTATLSGTPAAGDVGDHPVSLQVSDGTDTATQDFTITVADAGGTNNAPEFTSTAETDATAGTAYTYEVETTDADGDALTITAPTLPAWLTLTDNGDGTATLTGTPADSDVGDHAVSLQVSDGTDTATQDFTITVAEATTPPPPPPPGPTPTPRGDGGGGSLGFLTLLGLLGFMGVSGRRRKT